MFMLVYEHKLLKQKEYEPTMSTETQPRITEQNTEIPSLPELPAELAAENNEPQEPAYPYLKHGWNVLKEQSDGTFLIQQRSGYDKGPSVTATAKAVSAEQLQDLIAEDQEAAALEAADRAEADRQKAEEKAYTEAVDAKVALFEALDEDEPSEPAKRSFGRRIIDRLGYEEETGGFTRGDGYLTKAKRAERRAAKNAISAASEIVEPTNDETYAENESESSETEATTEREGLMSRIRNRISLGKDARERRTIARLEKKIAKDRARTQASKARTARNEDRLSDLLDAKREAELEDEAYAENWERDAPVREAEEAARAEALRAAREEEIAKGREAIIAARNQEANDILNRAIEFAESLRDLGAMEAAKYDGPTEAKRKLIRNRLNKSVKNITKRNK